MEETRFRVRLLVEATIAPSEDPQRVSRAVENLVGGAAHVVDLGEDRVRITSDDRTSLSIVRDQLRDRHVRSAARRLLLSSKSSKNSTTVMLNRQAAFQGVLALCSSEAESPLGPIFMTIRSDDLDSVIEWLTAYPSSYSEG